MSALLLQSLNVGTGVAGPLVVLVTVAVVWAGAQRITGWVNGLVTSHQESPYQRAVSF